MDFRYVQTDHARISKRVIKRKRKPTLQLKWHTKAKWLTQRRQKIHSHKPTTSTEFSHLQELVPGRLTKILFDHVVFGRQTKLMVLM